jgi:hypothetical protein
VAFHQIQLNEPAVIVAPSEKVHVSLPNLTARTSVLVRIAGRAGCLPWN